MKKLLSLAVLLPWAAAVLGQIQSGPMVGYVEMREAMLWVQTKAEASVYATYQRTDSADGRVFQTKKVQTAAAHGYTAHLLCDSVQPGRVYRYDIFVGKKKMTFAYETSFRTPPLWQYRTDPPAFKVAVGSCAYINEPRYDRPGKGYGSHYEIFSAIAKQRPEAMMWLGDNTYLREADWGTATGFYHRYTHSRSLPELQPLLAATAHYAIWDDHDYGPNDSDMSFRNKELAMQVFQDFWGNPTYGTQDLRGAITSWNYGDAEFFLTDGRWHRSSSRKKTGSREILGKAQCDWLINALLTSNATFKFVCMGSQFLNDAALYENHIHVAPEEREYILNAIAAEGIKNVIFLTGDRHHSELSMLQRNGITMYDWTVSPFTSGVSPAEKEANTLRVANSHVGEHNFGVLDFTGKKGERVLTLRAINAAGSEVWKYEIRPEKASN